MEIVIQKTDGIPSESILSIRSGTTRRQAQLASVDKPFKFPCKPEDCAAVKIDVFQHVGTARTVSQAGTNEHKLILEPVANTNNQNFSNDMQILFQTRPSDRNAPSMSDGIVDQGLKQKTEMVMEKYLEQHNLTAFLQSVLQGLVKEQPDNPYGFIARQFVSEAFEIRARKETPAPKEDAMKDLDELRQTVKNLEKELSGLVVENRELKAINELKATFNEDDSMRNEARGLFLESAKNGALNGALSQMSEAREMDALKNKAKDTLANAAKGSQLRDTLQWILGKDLPKTDVPEVAEVDPLAKLRFQARDDMLAAMEDGRLADILRVVKPSRRLEDWFDGSISSYYRRHISASINKNAWATIHSMFEPVKKLERPPKVQVVDDDSIQVLNSELEQLAKDRAVLLEQVNIIRSLMVDVAADNNRLAQEVLARPMSGGAQMCLTHSLSNLL